MKKDEQDGYVVDVDGRQMDLLDWIDMKMQEKKKPSRKLPQKVQRNFRDKRDKDNRR